MRRLADLWAGRLTLSEAFWTWAVVIGLTANLAATAGSLVALALELPGIVALAIHLLPLPYNLACAVGVWRSADAYPGPRHLGDCARVGVIAWAAALTIL